MKNSQKRWFARSLDALENGSFIVIYGKEFSLYILGDYHGTKGIECLPSLVNYTEFDGNKNIVPFTPNQMLSLLEK